MDYPAFAPLISYHTSLPEDVKQAIAYDPAVILNLYAGVATDGCAMIEELREIIRKNACQLKYADRKAIRHALYMISSSKVASRIFRWMMEDGVLPQLFPGIEQQVGYDQWTGHHVMPLWEHTLAVVQRTTELCRDPLIVLAALLHDIGKPTVAATVYRCKVCGKESTEPRDGKPRPYADCLTNENNPCGFETAPMIRCIYPNHGNVGAEIVDEHLLQLGFKPDTAQTVMWLVAYHDVPFDEEWTEEKATEFENRHGILTRDVLTLARADRLAHAPWRCSTHSIDRLTTFFKEVA